MFLAVFIACCGCIFDSVSLAVWRMAGLQMYNTRRVIVIGYFLQFTSMLLDVTSLAFLAEFTHSVVDAFSLVASLIISTWLLGEKPSLSDTTGALCVVLGILLTVVNRPVQPHLMDYGEAILRFNDPKVLVWFLGVAGVACSFYLLVHGDTTRRCKLLPVAAGFIGALSETLAKVMTLSINNGGLTNTLTIAGVVGLYILSELYIIRASVQILPMYLHQPTFFGAWAVGGMFSGSIVYYDFRVYDHHFLNLALTILGVALVLFGCFIPTLFGTNGVKPVLSPQKISTHLTALAGTPIENHEMEMLASKG